MEHCDRLYLGADDHGCRALNLALFEGLHIDRDGIKRAVLKSPFAELTDRSIGLTTDSDDWPDHDPEGPDDPDKEPWAETTYRAKARHSRPLAARARSQETPRPSGPGV